MKKICIPILTFVVGVLCVVLGVYLPTDTFMGKFVYRFLPRIVAISGAIYTFVYLIDDYPKTWILIILNSLLIFMPFVYTIIMVRIVD